MNINRVTAKKAKALRVLNANGSAIVSWVLYAKGKDGTGINNPISYAISRLEIDPTGGAGGGYDQLASLPPQDLLDVIHAFAQGRSILDLQEGDQASRLWLDLMGRDRDTALGLLRLLMGEDAPLRKEVVTQSEKWTETEDGVEIAINTSTKKI